MRIVALLNVPIWCANAYLWLRMGYGLMGCVALILALVFFLTYRRDFAP